MRDLLNKLAEFPTRFILAAIGMILFLSFNGRVHLFDPDELMYAEYAREMLLSGNFSQIQMNFIAFVGKNPLFTWLQAFSMKLFGINEFAARFPNTIFGMLSIVLVYNIGKNYFSKSFGVFWALLLGASFLPLLFYKSGVNDVVANYFVLLSIYWLFKISIKDEFESRKMMSARMFRFTAYSALASSMAMLTSGAINMIIIVFLITLVLLWNRGRITLDVKNLFIWLSIQIALIIVWLYLETRTSSAALVSKFVFDEFNHITSPNKFDLNFLYSFIPVFLVGCFPSTVFMWHALKRNNNDTIHQLLFKRWMLALLAMVFVLFCFQTDHFVYQMHLAFFPVTFMAAYTLNGIYQGKIKWNFIYSFMLFVGALIWFEASSAVIYIFAEQRFDIVERLVHLEYLQTISRMNVYWNLNMIAVPSIFLILIAISIILFYLKKNLYAIATVLTSSIIFFSFVILYFAPKVDKYYQGEVYDFVAATKIESPKYEISGFKTNIPNYYGGLLPDQKKLNTYLIHRKTEEIKFDTAAYDLIQEKVAYSFYKKK
jgi:4-amino-4-deoxy-L-arabinose transferase-like glycosyltransferase